jgi:16S rRNA (guanine1516-N2)-methyltransferase
VFRFSGVDDEDLPVAVRAGTDPEIGPLIRDRLSLTLAEGCALMSRLSEDQRPDVVYLDPMYPHRTKTALVKKEMRALRHLVGEDPDTSALLHGALNCARHRVVVKRPRLAPAIDGPLPGMAIEGKNTRFDVYLI